MRYPQRDDLHLAKLRRYYQRYKALPSVSRIAEIVGLKSSGSTFQMLGRLIEEGFVQRTPDRRLAPGKRFFERQVVSSVKAGRPQEASQQAPESVSIDAYLVEHPSRTVLLTVKGDSMIDAGLMPGDTIIVVKGGPAKAGDIVVAIVDNEFTVKYLDFDKKRNAFFLRAGNIAYAPIRPKDELEIYGVVVGSFRKYKR